MRVTAPIVPTTLERVRVAAMRRTLGGAGKSFLITAVAVMLLAAFLSPMLRSITTALKSPEQTTALGAPLWPADPATIEFEGKDYEIYRVPIDGEVRDLALFKKGRQESQFIDPADPSAPPIIWQGSWRALERGWELAPKWENFSDVWRLINYPRLLFNTIALAIIGTIGTVLSCTLVAYGFARFRIPGKQILFTLLIATIFLPTAVTLIPTYTIFVQLGWVGTWLPLLVPAFFANAYDVFLLRQFFMTIPRELDEAAAMDGAGPFRTLISVVLPQAWPAVIAVTIFHLVYAWNDFFGPLIYLSTRADLQPISVGLARFNGIYFENPAYVQAGTLMTMIIPLLMFLLFQRVFIRGIVITGVEK